MGYPIPPPSHTSLYAWTPWTPPSLWPHTGGDAQRRAGEAEALNQRKNTGRKTDDIERHCGGGGGNQEGG